MVDEKYVYTNDETDEMITIKDARAQIGLFDAAYERFKDLIARIHL